MWNELRSQFSDVLFWKVQVLGLCLKPQLWALCLGITRAENEIYWYTLGMFLKSCWFICLLLVCSERSCVKRKNLNLLPSETFFQDKVVRDPAGSWKIQCFPLHNFCAMYLLCLCVSLQQCGIALKSAKLFVWFMSANSLPWITGLQAAMFSSCKIALIVRSLMYP